MKKITYILMLLSFIAVPAFAQIGINTFNPKAVLHIDGASTIATTNPETGEVTAAQAVDDVVIINSGNVGVGVLAPTTKVHISGPATGAIRLADGTQGDYKLLVSDGASGTSTWQSVGVAWFAFLSKGALPVSTAYTSRGVVNYSESSIASPLKGSINPILGTITVPVSGRYKVTIAGKFQTNRAGIGGLFKAEPQFKVNGTVAWAPTIFGPTLGMGVWPTFISFYYLTSGDVVSLAINETTTTHSNQISDAFLLVELN